MSGTDDRQGRPEAPASRSLLPYQLLFALGSASISAVIALLGELRGAVGMSDLGAGVVVMSGFVAALVALVTLAPLADRGHGPRLVLIGLVLGTAGLVLMTVAPTTAVFVAGRAITGFGEGMILPGVRRVAAVLDPTKVGENLGRLMVGEVVGMVYLDAGPMRLPFEEDDLRLVAVLGHMAAAKIRAVRLTEEVAQKRAMEKEMALARQIQVRILPDKLPTMEKFELFGINVACRQVSGDLYGAWSGPEGKTWLAIADVAGKGIGPGLLMATFSAFMQAWSEFAQEPSPLALKLSLALSKRTTTNRFITAFLALLDPAEGTLTFTNAGHNPILLLKADGTQELLQSQGFPLAMFPGGDYGQGSVRMEPGDLLFLYTDGITEATDPDGMEFDIEVIGRTLRELGPVPLEELHRGLNEALLRHTRGAPLADDQTIVLVRRRV